MEQHGVIDFVLTGRFLRHDLLQQIRFHRDFPAERPIVGGDQQDGHCDSGGEDPHRGGGSASIIAMDHGDGDQRANQLAAGGPSISPNSRSTG